MNIGIKINSIIIKVNLKVIYSLIICYNYRMHFDTIYPTIFPRPFPYISLQLHVHLTFHGVLSYTFYLYAFCTMYVQYTYA